MVLTVMLYFCLFGNSARVCLKTTTYPIALATVLIITIIINTMKYFMLNFLKVNIRIINII